MSRHPDKDEGRRYRSDGRSEEEEDLRIYSNRGEEDARDRRERSRYTRDGGRDREDRRERSRDRGRGDERRSRDDRRERSHDRDRGREQKGRLNRDRDRSFGDNFRQQERRSFSHGRGDEATRWYGGEERWDEGERIKREGITLEAPKPGDWEISDGTTIHPGTSKREVFKWSLEVEEKQTALPGWTEEKLEEWRARPNDWVNVPPTPPSLSLLEFTSGDNWQDPQPVLDSIQRCFKEENGNWIIKDKEEILKNPQYFSDDEDLMCVNKSAIITTSLRRLRESKAAREEEDRQMENFNGFGGRGGFRGRGSRGRGGGRGRGRGRNLGDFGQGRGGNDPNKTPVSSRRGFGSPMMESPNRWKNSPSPARRRHSRSRSRDRKRSPSPARRRQSRSRSRDRRTLNRSSNNREFLSPQASLKRQRVDPEERGVDRGEERERRRSGTSPAPPPAPATVSTPRPPAEQTKAESYQEFKRRRKEECERATRNPGPGI